MYGVTKKEIRMDVWSHEERDQDGCVESRRKIKSGTIKGSVEVAPLTKKIADKRLKWYRHVKAKI